MGLGAPHSFTVGLGGLDGRMLYVHLTVDGGNKYLRLTGASKATNKVPWPFQFDVELASIVYSNSVALSDGTLDIRKNGVDSGDNLTTWTFTDIDTGYKTDGLSTFTFDAGDTMTCFMNKGTNATRDGYVTLGFRIIDDTTGEVS